MFRQSKLKKGKLNVFNSNIFVCEKSQGLIWQCDMIIDYSKTIRGTSKNLSHKGTPAYLSSTKYKGKSNQYFFPSRTKKEMKIFAWSCETCHRAVHPNDIKESRFKIGTNNTGNIYKSKHWCL